MKLLLRALAALALTAASAFATTWNVTPTGTGNASLATANSNCAAGDTVKLAAGTYSVTIHPLHHGTSGHSITYLGNIANPTAAIVPGIELAPYAASGRFGNYTVVRWVQSLGNIGSEYHLDPDSGGNYVATKFDTLHKITVVGGTVKIVMRASLVDSVTLTGTDINAIDANIDLGNANGDGPNVAGQPTGGNADSRFLRPAGVTVRNSTFNITTSSGSTAKFQSLHLFKSAYCTFFNNTFNLTCNGTNNEYWFPVEFYFSYFNLVQGNTFNLTMNQSTTHTKAIWALRDSTSYCRFVGNTVRVTGPGQIGVGWAQNGACIHSTHHNYAGNNTIYIQNSGGGGFTIQDPMRADTLEFNTVTVGDNQPAFAIQKPDSVIGAVIRHNTFHSPGPNVAASIPSGTPISSSRWVSNIASVRNGSQNVSAYQAPTGMALDSAGVFYVNGGRAEIAIDHYGSQGAPGSGAGFGGAATSLWGDPKYVDPNPATFDPHLQSGSVALTGTLAGGYAGPFGSTAASGHTSYAVTNDSTLWRAMTLAVEGDVVNIANGTYAGSNFSPWQMGSLNNGLIRIVGNVAHPESVKVVGAANISTGRHAISGISFRDGALFVNATNDSIKNCVFFVASGVALEFQGSVSGLVFTNNTVLSNGLVGCRFSGTSLPTGSTIKGNVFSARGYKGNCSSTGVMRGACLLMPLGGYFGCDSNYFAPAVAEKAAGVYAASANGCWTLAQWQANTGNDPASKSAPFTATLFNDARYPTIDLRPAARSVLYNAAAPGGHYGALEKP